MSVPMSCNRSSHGSETGQYRSNIISTEVVFCSSNSSRVGLGYVRPFVSYKWTIVFQSLHRYITLNRRLFDTNNFVDGERSRQQNLFKNSRDNVKRIDTLHLLQSTLTTVLTYSIVCFIRCVTDQVSPSKCLEWREKIVLLRGTDTVRLLTWEVLCRCRIRDLGLFQLHKRFSQEFLY